MGCALTFVIPICHPENCKDWVELKRNLEQTVVSVASQSSNDWAAIVVANRHSDLPALPAQFSVCWVDFQPNPHYEQRSGSVELFRESVRLDKGRRILAGLLSAGKMQHMMIVDADDFINKSLTAFVRSNPDRTGWYLSEGYAYEENSSILFLCHNFNTLCGTSHIIRADLFELPASVEAAPESYIRHMLGSHVFIDEYLERSGNGLARLPFVGAIYRMGHPNSHSRSVGVVRSFLLQPSLLWNPKRLLGRILCLRYLTKSIRSEFFGSGRE